MCQMTAVFEKDGTTETLMENLTLLEADAGGVTVSTMFEPPRRIEGARVVRIDFMAGTVVLDPGETE